jgi:hypothetical protein
VAVDSYPNNAHNNRAISLAEHEQILLPFGRTGFIGYSATLPVYAGASARTLYLRAGVRGTVRGTRFNITSEHTIGPDMILANTSGSPRRDLLVMRLDRAATDPNKFTVAPVVLTGVPAAAPVAPAPVRNDTMDGTGVWDFPVTEIPVPNGATTLALTAADFRGWWCTTSGYTGLEVAKPPIEPGMIFRANDTGISYVGSNTGKWQRIYQNTGWINVSAPSGWTASPFAFARVNDLVVMSARIIRTGATVPATTSVTMYKVAEQFRPTQATYGVYHASYPDHSSHVAVGTDGSVVFAGAGTAALTISQNSTVLSNMVWLATP